MKPGQISCGCCLPTGHLWMPLTGRAERRFSVCWLPPSLMTSPWLANPAKRQLGKGSLCRYSTCCCNPSVIPFPGLLHHMLECPKDEQFFGTEGNCLGDIATMCIVAMISMDIVKTSLDNMDDSTVCFAHHQWATWPCFPSHAAMSSIILCINSCSADLLKKCVYACSGW